MEQGCVFLTSLEVEAGEKRAERHSQRFTLMEWLKREQVKRKRRGVGRVKCGERRRLLGGEEEQGGQIEGFHFVMTSHRGTCLIRLGT